MTQKWNLSFRKLLTSKSYICIQLKHIHVVCVLHINFICLVKGCAFNGVRSTTELSYTQDSKWVSSETRLLNVSYWLLFCTSYLSDIVIMYITNVCRISNGIYIYMYFYKYILIEFQSFITPKEITRLKYLLKGWNNTAFEELSNFKI